LGVEKLAMETDSPIFQSILPAEPPPLFRVFGVMDWEFKEVYINNKLKKYRSLVI
jgi:hypothetical protein